MNKKLYERHPLILAEKSPLKIFSINLETPYILCLLVRVLYIDNNDVDLKISH